MDYKFRLSKVHCAGCALALEQILNQIDGVKAEINFVLKQLKLSIQVEGLDGETEDEVLEKVKTAIHTFDHSIELADFVDEEDESKKEKKERTVGGFRQTLFFWKKKTTEPRKKHINFFIRSIKIKRFLCSALG